MSEDSLINVNVLYKLIKIIATTTRHSKQKEQDIWDYTEMAVYDFIWPPKGVIIVMTTEIS